MEEGRDLLSSGINAANLNNSAVWKISKNRFKFFYFVNLDSSECKWPLYVLWCSGSLKINDVIQASIY